MSLCLKSILIASIVIPLLTALAGGDAPATQPAASPPLRVTSFNIRFGTADDGPDHWSKRKTFVADTIRRHDADLLGLQEADPFQVDYIAREVPGYEVVGKDAGHGGGDNNSLLFRSDRFERLDSGRFWLSETPERPSKSWDSSMVRATQWARLRDKAGGGELLFLNAHFDHRGPISRLRAAELLREKAAEIAGPGTPVVITGDFNAAEDTDPYKALTAAEAEAPPLIDSYREVPGQAEGKDQTFTFHAFKGTSNEQHGRIDWVLHSKDFAAVESSIDRTAYEGRFPSDHFPVSAVLERRDPTADPTTRPGRP